MFKNLRLLPILGLLLFTFQQANSQCNTALTIEPAFDCSVAAASAVNGSGTGFVCDLNNFCISTGDVPAYPPGQEIPFCGPNSVLNNPIWFSFIADDSGILDLVVKSEGCTGGFQWALYNQCGQYFNTVACQSNPVLPPNTAFFIYANPITPGDAYYLVIDGANGATCSYSFTVNDGISPVLVGDPIAPGNLIGNTSVCGGTSVQYSFPGIEFATDYTWTMPDGSIVESAGPEVDFTFPEGMAAGTYQICVTGANDCDPNTDSQPVCWDIIVGDEPVFDIIATVCEGETFAFRNYVLGVGSYVFNFNGVGNSGCDTTYNVTVDQLTPAVTLTKQVYKCPEDTYAYIDNVPYTGGPNGTDVTYTDSRGCDSVVTYYINDIQVDGNIIAQPASLPCDGSGNSTLALNPIWLYQNTHYDIFWYDQDNVQIGVGNFAGVTEPGVYRAEVITYMQNPPNVLPSPGELSCTKIFTITVLVENSTLIAPITSGTPVLCAGDQYTYNVTNMQLGVTSYSWEYTGGTVGGGDDGANINLSYTTPGLYEVCVNAIDGCGPGPQTCFPVQVVPSATVSLPAAYAVCATGDSLTATLGGVPNPDDPLMHYLWTATAGPDIAGVVFSPGNEPVTDVTVTQPGTYTFRFSADYNGQGCGEAKTIDVTFEEALILTPQNVQACNDVLQPLPSIISLDTLLTGNGVPYTGTWTMVSGPGGIPGGTLPVQDFTGLVNTGIYVYEFTPNQPGVCAVAAVQVEIDLTNCICPPLSIEPVGGSVCNDIGDVDLSTLVLGGTGTGTWGLTGSPAGSSVSVVGNVADFSAQPSGSYEFTYTLAGSMAGCPSTGVTTVTVNAAPVATLKTLSSACNSNFSPDYVNLVEFDTLILSGVMTGVWAYTGVGADPGTGGFHPHDFNGAVPGTYEYTYTITGDPSCQAVSYTIEIIIEDCKCPSVAISREESFCNTTPSINLDDYKVTTKAGSWSIQSAPSGSIASIQNGNTLLSTGSTYGQYVLVFTLNVASPVGCMDTAQLILSLDSTSFAGTSVPFDLCADFGSGVDLDTVLALQQAGGTWAYTGPANIGTSFNAATGVIDFTTLPEGTGYTFSYTVSSPLGLCPDATSMVTVAKNVLPVADAGTDAFIDCVTQQVNLGGAGTSTGGAV